jgi:5-methyltetrahydropteroyltriglutamate--homocysteine methyltransferase
MLETTTVGSFPKPNYLLKARSSFERKKIGRAKLAELEKQATEECIRSQERLGLDILVSGEMERGDMATYFADQLDGMSVSGPVRSYGNRYYRKPIVEGEIKRNKPMTVEMWKYAQSLTDEPVKANLTGPYTLCDWSFNRHYKTRRDIIMTFAEALRAEVKELEAAGAKYIQIDEPALSTRPDEIDIAVEAMHKIMEGVNTYTIAHICYGDLSAVYPKLMELPVNNLDLEFANSNFRNMEVFREPKADIDISVGVIDIHSHVVEPKEHVKDGLRKALDIFDSSNLFVSPDCGLKTRTLSETEAKLTVMIEAVREIKEEYGFE